jgi:hypothetical protein
VQHDAADARVLEEVGRGDEIHGRFRRSRYQKNRRARNARREPSMKRSLDKRNAVRGFNDLFITFLRHFQEISNRIGALESPRLLTTDHKASAQSSVFSPCYWLQSGILAFSFLKVMP